MKQKLKYSILSVLLFASMLCVGCADISDQNSEIDNHIDSISCPFFEEGELEMWTGEDTTGWININTQKSSGIEYDDIVFVTDNPDVAKVKITGDRAGSFIYYQIYAAGEGNTYVYAQTTDGEVLSPKQHIVVLKNDTETTSTLQLDIPAGIEAKKQTEIQEETVSSDPTPPIETEIIIETDTESQPQNIEFVPIPEIIDETISEYESETIPETETDSNNSTETEIISGSSMTAELIEELEGVAVFWAPTGNKVHLLPNCWSFKLGVTYAGTLEEAQSVRTKGWCGSCGYGISEENIYATKEVLARCYTYEDYLNQNPSWAFE